MNRLFALLLILTLCAGCSPKQDASTPSASPVSPSPAAELTTEPSESPVANRAWAWDAEFKEDAWGEAPSRQDPEAYNAWVTEKLDRWAELCHVSFDFSDEDVAAAVQAVREELDTWADEPFVLSFRVDEIAPSRAETLNFWREYFDRKSQRYMDWTQEDMEQDLIAVTAKYTCEYDGSLTPLEWGELTCTFMLVRENGRWTIDDHSWGGGLALIY